MSKNLTQKLEKPEGPYIVEAVRDMLSSKAGGYVPPHHLFLKRLWWALFWPLPLLHSPFHWGATTLSSSTLSHQKNNRKIKKNVGNLRAEMNTNYDVWKQAIQFLSIWFDSPLKLYHKCASLLFNRYPRNSIKGTKLALTTQKKDVIETRDRNRLRHLLRSWFDFEFRLCLLTTQYTGKNLPKLSRDLNKQPWEW